MREVEIKTDLFLKELARVDFADVFEKIDSNGATIFRAFQGINDGNCIIVLVLDDSIYNTVTYTFGRMDDESRRTEMLNLLNQLSQNYKALHFFIDDDNQIVATFSYTAVSEYFNGDILLTMIVNLFKLIESQIYDNIMRVIGS